MNLVVMLIKFYYTYRYNTTKLVFLSPSRFNVINSYCICKDIDQQEVCMYTREVAHGFLEYRYK